MSHSLSTRRVSAVSYNAKQSIGMNLYIQTTPTLKLMSRKPKVLFTRHHRWFSRQSYIYYEITLLSPRNWRLRNEHSNSILTTCQDSGLDSASDWLRSDSHAAQPIRSTAQIRLVNVIRMEFLRSFLRLDFEGKPGGGGGVAICCPFSLASIIFIPGYCYSWHHSKVWGINLTLNKPKTDWIEYTR